MKRAYIPFIDKIRVELANRRVWQYKIFREFPNVADYFVKWSQNLFCVICKRQHNTESGLRKCLSDHKWDSINYFIDHELIEASSQ